MKYGEVDGEQGARSRIVEQDPEPVRERLPAGVPDVGRNRRERCRLENLASTIEAIERGFRRFAGLNDGDEVANGRDPLGDDEVTSSTTDTGTAPSTGPGTTDSTDPTTQGRKGAEDTDKLSSSVACGCRTGSGGSMGLLLAPLLWRQRRRSSQVTAS